MKKEIKELYDADAVHETVLSFIMMGALNYQLSILDGAYQKQAKKWFNTLFSAAKNLWFILDKAMSIEVEYDKAKGFFSDKSSFLYDCNRILVDLPKEKHQAILRLLKDELEQKYINISLSDKTLPESKKTPLVDEFIC